MGAGAATLTGFFSATSPDFPAVARTEAGAGAGAGAEAWAKDPKERPAVVFFTGTVEDPFIIAAVAVGANVTPSPLMPEGGCAGDATAAAEEGGFLHRLA